MVKTLTFGEKRVILDKISNKDNEKEIELLFNYIEKIEATIKEYELNISLLLNIYNKNKGN